MNAGPTRWTGDPLPESRTAAAGGQDTLTPTRMQEILEQAGDPQDRE